MTLSRSQEPAPVLGRWRVRVDEVDRLMTSLRAIGIPVAIS